MSTTPHSDFTDCSNAELRALASEAAQAAMLVLLPYSGQGNQALNQADYDMVRVAISLMIMRKAGRPITA